jgi:hypothetical protein
MKLSIGKLSRLLNKALKEELDRYGNDLYDDRINIGTLTVILNGEDISFEIRNFKYNPKRYKLTLYGVNWTHHAGYCSINITTENIKSMFFKR